MPPTLIKVGSQRGIIKPPLDFLTDLFPFLFFPVDGLVVGTMATDACCGVIGLIVVCGCLIQNRAVNMNQNPIAL